MKRIFYLTIVLLAILTACSNQSSKELISSAETKAKAGDHEGAIADFTKAIEMQGDTADVIAIWHRGNSRTMVKDFKGAVDDYSLVIQKLPKSANAYFCRGNCKQILGDYAGAIPDFDNVVKFDTINAKAYYLRGFSKVKTGVKTEALSDLNKAIQLDPKMNEPYLERGKLSLEAGNTAEACADFTKAKELGSTEANGLIKKSCK